MFAGGCADSGFAASVGAPTICAVGPIGGCAHSPEEYLEVDSIVPRAQALALAIMRLEGGEGCSLPATYHPTPRKKLFSVTIVLV